MTPDTPDDVALTARLDRIKKLTDDLARAQHDAQAMRDLVDRIRRELDAARATLKLLDSH